MADSTGQTVNAYQEQYKRQMGALGFSSTGTVWRD